MRDFHKLRVWDQAHQATLEVYRATRTFPKKSCMDSPLRCDARPRPSALMLPRDVAAEAGPSSRGSWTSPLGSASELEYHLLLSADLKLLDRSAYAQLNPAVVQVKRMLAGLVRKLRAET